MISDSETVFVADRDYARQRGLKGQHAYVTVRWETEPGRETDDAGQRAVDEILTTQVNLEMMDESNCWADVCGLRVWFRAYRVKGEREPRLVVTAEPESCSPADERAALEGDG